MKKKQLLATVIAIPLLSWSQSQYTVRKGDTLLKIADKTLGNTNPKDPRRFEVVKKIRSLNPEMKNPNALEPGQSIKIPDDTKIASGKKTPPAAPTVTSPVAPPAPPPVPVPEAPPVVKTPPVDVAPNTHETTKIEPPSAPVPPPPPVAPTPPSATPMPAEHAPQHKHAEVVHHNFFFLQPRYQMVEISTKELATETEASMKSQSSVGLDVQYAVILNQRLHMLFQAGVTQTQFKDIEGETLPTVNHKSETLKSFALGIAYDVTSNFHLDLMLMQAERTFLLPATLPEYELHAIALPGAEFNISWDIYTGANNIFGISAIAEYIGGLKKDDVEYKSTTEPIGAIYWKSNYGHDRVNYKVTLTYKKGHQDTSLTKQHEDLSALGVGFYF